MWPVKKLTRPCNEHGKLSTRHVGHKSVGDSPKGEKGKEKREEKGAAPECEPGCSRVCMTTENKEQEQELEPPPVQLSGRRHCRPGNEQEKLNQTHGHSGSRWKVLQPGKANDNGVFCQYNL